MNVLEYEVQNPNDQSKNVKYKSTFTTSDGVIHRVDFDSRGKIGNLCEYTGFTPDMNLNDLEEMISEIKEIINK